MYQAVKDYWALVNKNTGLIYKVFMELDETTYTVFSIPLKKWIIIYNENIKNYLNINNEKNDILEWSKINDNMAYAYIKAMCPDYQNIIMTMNEAMEDLHQEDKELDDDVEKKLFIKDMEESWNLSYNGPNN